MNEEFRQDPGPRDGEMRPISSSLRVPEKIRDVDCECVICGLTFKAELYNWPIRMFKDSDQAREAAEKFRADPRHHRDPLPAGFFNYEWQERIIGGGLCPACREKRAEEDRKAEEAARAAEFMKDRLQARLTCGIEARYQNEDFSTFKLEGVSAEIKRAYRRAWEYAENFPVESRGRGYRSLVLFSDRSWGVGKSHLATAIAHRILDRWQGIPSSCPVLFISEPELLLSITATYNYSPEEKMLRDSEADIINRLISIPLLIIDDVGKRKVADLRFVQRIHFSIIDGRYKRLRPIVLTANLGDPDLGHYLGGIRPSEGGEADEATLDRLIEMCGGWFNKMDGKSYRRRARDTRAKGGQNVSREP